jgi:hypothetical protein
VVERKFENEKAVGSVVETRVDPINFSAGMFDENAPFPRAIIE